jgi:hypothetical protein
VRPRRWPWRLGAGSRHIRGMLVSYGWNAQDAALAIFSRFGFTDELRVVAADSSDEILLLGLEDLYER